MSEEITPFQIAITDDVVSDLRGRLLRTRWPERETVSDWSQGAPLGFVQHMCAHWAERYDWSAAERRLNEFPQFLTSIDGLDVHFLFVRSPNPDAVPLLLTHGWPGSTVEFHKVMGPLADPVAHGGAAADAFHVVCPSLPGFGFSERPSEPGWGVDRIADAWTGLMGRLGFDRFAVQGGDWGAAVSTAIGRRHATRVIGVHLNFVLVEMGLAADDLTEAERSAIDDYVWHQRWDMGYSQLQATRPQTLGYGLVDSPAAQCAWILEKFWSWTDCSGDPLSVFSEDELLDNVMMYWLPGTGASSGRLYWESFYRPKAEPLVVPVGCTIFPREIRRPSRRWASRHFHDIRWWNEVSRGGHFAAFEQPDIFVDEVRAAFQAIRAS